MLLYIIFALANASLFVSLASIVVLLVALEEFPLEIVILTYAKRHFSLIENIWKWKHAVLFEAQVLHVVYMVYLNLLVLFTWKHLVKSSSHIFAHSLNSSSASLICMLLMETNADRWPGYSQLTWLLWIPTRPDGQSLAWFAKSLKELAKAPTGKERRGTAYAGMDLQPSAKDCIRLVWREGGREGRNEVHRGGWKMEWNKRSKHSYKIIKQGLFMKADLKVCSF